jgi:hypothetical protein
VTRGDLDYSALWILYAATPLAQIEVIARRLVPDREVIPQAAKLNPAFFDVIYSQLLNTRKTAEAVGGALDVIDTYLPTDRHATLFRLCWIICGVGEGAVSGTRGHFTQHMNLSSVTTVCEYLADLQMLGKASPPVRLTRSSNVEVQELAFFYVGDVPSRR